MRNERIFRTYKKKHAFRIRKFTVVPKYKLDLRNMQTMRHPNAPTFSPTSVYDPVKRHDFCITFLIIMLYHSFIKEWPLSHNYIMIVFPTWSVETIYTNIRAIQMKRFFFNVICSTYRQFLALRDKE